MILDLKNYFVVPEQNFNKKGFHKFHKFINTGQIHSVSMIFHPTGKNTYDVFYINSHGHTSFDEKTYELKVSNTRIKEYKFNSNVNHIFNLGHGVLPETDPMMIDYLVKLVKNY